jgi:predicted HAD superfamily Cof-like phosphohydrolase
MTNFEKVKEFNRAFGLEVPSVIRPHLFVQDPKQVHLKLNLILEEVEELKEALQKEDLVETVDALADILYVVYGAGISFGVDMDKAFSIVHLSNMSKLCRTQKEAEETVQWYKDQFVQGTVPYDSPIYRHDPTTGYYIVLNQSTGKILKNIHYQPVDLYPILKENGRI